MATVIECVITEHKVRIEGGSATCAFKIAEAIHGPMAWHLACAGHSDEHWQGMKKPTDEEPTAVIYKEK